MELPAAKLTAEDWKVKSSTEFMSVSRTYGDSFTGSAS